MRALPVMFAVLLVFAAVGSASPGPAAPATTAASATADSVPAVDPVATGPSAVSSAAATNQTAANATLTVLGIPESDVQRDSLETHHVELGPALAFDSNATDARLTTLAAVDRIESAESEDQRQQLLLQELTNVEQEVITLRARQRAAVRAYSAGTIDSRALLVRLAIIDIDARALEQRRERIERLSQETSGFSIEGSRFASLERDIDAFTGPVRQHAAATLGGDADATRFFVQTGGDSLVLGTIRNGTYVREAYRADNRMRNEGSISDLDALNATKAAYPHAYALQLRQNGTNLVGTSDNSFVVRIQHSRGQLYSFVDSGSGTVFKEFQYRPLGTLKTTPTESAVKDGLELTAHQTYPGGPVRIQLNSTETGDPVDARITVGRRGGRSVVVGETGADGSLWTMAHGQAYQVTAIDGNSVAVLTVQPTDPPLVNESPDGGSNASA